MNCPFSRRIADHLVHIHTSSSWVERWIINSLVPDHETCSPDLTIHIEEGFGRPFEGFDVHIHKTEGGTNYVRVDYSLEISSDYRIARLQVHDEYALRHAMLHLYSAVIVHLEWGLLIHSSCIVNDRKAHLFAGRSGAGKSTVASLSAPRVVLSDEASLVHIPKDGEVRVYDSPFRSDIATEADPDNYPLAAIHLLNQSECVYRTSISSSDAFRKLTGLVFYWAHDPKETTKVIRLIEKLAKYVQAYDLYFQKNASFWGLIS